MCNVYPLWVLESSLNLFLREVSPAHRSPLHFCRPSLQHNCHGHILIYTPGDGSGHFWGPESVLSSIWISPWTWEEWVQVSIVSLSRLSYVGCAQKVRQEPEPMALALESSPPTCSVMGVCIYFVCGINSVKIKSAPPENPNLNLFLLGSCNKGKRGRDSYPDANTAVYETSIGCGLFHWILARTWWG